MPKKKNVEEVPVRRECDCWLDIGYCFCHLNEEELKSVRYSVWKKGDIHSRWATLKDALNDGRKRVKPPFKIFDHIEDKFVIEYE